MHVNLEKGLKNMLVCKELELKKAWNFNKSQNKHAQISIQQKMEQVFGRNNEKNMHLERRQSPSEHVDQRVC